MKTPQKVTTIPDSMLLLAEILFSEHLSCVIRTGDTIRLFRERGIKDLFRILKEHPEWLQGARVADKVVGKGAAALMLLGGVEELFSDVISYPALELLARHNVVVSYTIAVERIANRTKTGLCPIEELCIACETPEEALRKIEDFILSQS